MGPIEANRRATYRVSAAEARIGRLRFPNQEILVEIIDESADGFAILVGGILDCHVGQDVLLQTEAGWAEARIMNAAVAPLGLATNDDVSELDCTRIGLLRIRDLPPEHKTTWKSFLSAVRRPLMPLYSSWCGAISTIGCVIMGGLIVVCGLEYPHSMITLERRPMPPTGSSSASSSQSPSISWPEWRWSTQPSTGNDDILQFARPNFLLNPEISSALALSPRQFAMLRSLADRDEGTNPQRVLEILSSAQLAELRRLSEHLPKSE